MYPLFDNLHHYNRYIILAALVLVLFNSFSGWFGKKNFSAFDGKSSLVLMISTHIQLLLGLLLYFVFSPITTNAIKDMGAAMKNADIRYFAVEHITAMLLAVVLITIGRISSKKATTDEAKHKKLAIFTSLAALIIIGTLASKGLLFGRN